MPGLTADLREVRVATETGALRSLRREELREWEVLPELAHEVWGQVAERTDWVIDQARRHT